MKVSNDNSDFGTKGLGLDSPLLFMTLFQDLKVTLAKLLKLPEILKLI